MSLYVRYQPAALGGGGGGGGSLTIGPIDSQSPAADGASALGLTLYLQSASATVPGLVNNAAQSFSGAKTFTGSISALNLSGTNTGDVTIGTANGLSLAGQALSLALSSTSTTGALSSTDWNTFNNKQSTLTLGNLTDAGTDGIVITGGTGAVVGSGTSIAQHVADTTHNGYLSSTDWNTFNGKLSPFGNQAVNTVYAGPASGGSAAPTFRSLVVADLSFAGAANGVATLDSGGKVPVTQLPSTIMEYQGAWDASTNTPTLADGTGRNGDVYRTSVAGTQNLGSGSQTYFVGDFVIYNGSIWQRSPAADGVTSVNGATGAVTVNAINQLTGDATAGPASGSASAALTLATVNSNVGSFTNSSITVNAKGLITAASSGSAGVTSLTIASANGFAGTSSGGSTPALTLSTSITGILQGNGTAISAATTTGSGAVVLATSPALVTPALGTPSALVLTNATGLPVAGGGTGAASFTAFAPVIGGTTSTAALQSASSGMSTSGNVLTSTGSGSAPTWQTPAGGTSTQYAWCGWHTSASQWSATSTTFVDAVNGGSSTLTQVSNSNFGTVTSAAGGVAGITFTVPATGYYYVKVGFLNDDSTGSYLQSSLTDGTTSIDQVTYFNSGLQTWIIMTGVINFSSLVSKTMKIQLASGSGTNFINVSGAISAPVITWSIFKI